MSGDRGIDFAWRVHDAIGEWTAKVDIKASIVLALESAAVAALVAISQPQQPLHGLGHESVWLYRGGVVATIVAIVAAGVVVTPRLGPHRAKRDPLDGLIYFGHLRAQEPAAIKARLESLDDTEELDQLAHQLAQTAKIAWRKHRWLQWSVLASAAGALFFAAAWLLK